MRHEGHAEEDPSKDGPRTREQFQSNWWPSGLQASASGRAAGLSVGDEDCSRKIGRWRIVTVGGERGRRPPGRPKESGAGAVGRREVETPLPRHGCLILTLWTPSSSSFSFPPPSFPLPPLRLRSPPASMTTPHVIASFTVILSVVRSWRTYPGACAGVDLINQPHGLHPRILLLHTPKENKSRMTLQGTSSESLFECERVELTMLLTSMIFPLLTVPRRVSNHGL